MSSVSASSHRGYQTSAQGSAQQAVQDAIAPGVAVASNRQLLVDIGQLDLSRRFLSREQLEHWMPHRGHMALIDWIVWQADDFKQGVALKQVRHDEFWVPGHFPGRPLMPGVLQVEAAAQLAVYLYNARQPEPLTPAFTRIENCSFRSMVQPGDDLYLLCREVKWSRRGFVCDVQGLCDHRIAFEAQVNGLIV